MNNSYRNQAALLIRVIPEIALEKRFALHGGTAINMFVRDMPRLSVDIDLTYIPIETRELSFFSISDALNKLKIRIEKSLIGIRVQHKLETHKLLISNKDAMIKVEVSPIVRGLLGEASEISLCKKAQNSFDAFCAIQVVSKGQLYGGKICAALDRQHPRDLFDVKHLLQNEGLTQEIKEGFLFRLLSSERTILDVLFPKYQDQQLALLKQFSGMSTEPFSYQEYIQTRETLLQLIHYSLTKEDKAFILSAKNADPDWSIYDFQSFPSIQWKQQNLAKIKKENQVKHRKLLESLRNKLENIQNQ